MASANQRETELQNSETFLLSNMSPQKPRFNRELWKKLEVKVRQLDMQASTLETYVISGPVFDFDKPMAVIGSEDSNGVTLPIPHAYFKSVLAETTRGALHMWSFLMPNEASKSSLQAFRVATTTVERVAGIQLWQRLVGKRVEREKSRLRRLWFS